ncbi:hypothetical protein PHMEG_00014261 [Phytophthora megakarya]|uniref:Transmembrane protein n=1 Tax=Phytophthora megakarya TaxID=4795 RepID=A0A225W479_9STRA|nr:hypothetical protein PHMEG_00014261 [Phytophthora megakarya]
MVSTALAVVFIGGILQFSGDGIQVDSFRSIDLDATEQKQLLDRYNSITAGLTALLMKPLDVFLSMVVAVVFLCLATKWSIHQENQRGYAMMIVIGVVGYMMNTGFSALNVQVIQGEIQPRITPSDLAVENFVDTSQPLDDSGFFATLSNTSYRENSRNNSVLNTILRNNFVLTDPPTVCGESQDYDVPYKEIVAYYGFPSRSWQKHALSKALEPTAKMTIPMNATASELPSDENLPMNISIATNLGVYALVTSNSFLGWWKHEDEAWGAGSQCTRVDRSKPLELATCFNLTTRSTADASFVSDFHDVIVNYFRKAENASVTNELANIQLSHINISDTVVFDALTIEVPTQYIGEQENNSFVSKLAPDKCNQGACFAMNVEEYKAEGAKTTVYPRVQALAICLNEAGGEDLVADWNRNRSSDVLQSCKQRSNTSMIIVSVGKRIEGDSFEDVSDDNVSPGQIVNARMVYSLTVGRLAWTVENLADVYRATCAKDEGCDGIRFPLERMKNSSTNDILLVSDNSIPIDSLSPINLNVNMFPVGSSQWKILVSTLEETRGGNLESMSATDPIVLPRNFKTINSSLATHMLNSKSCDRMIDKHLGNIEINHLYIEHSVQPAYTAGLYFIFQNAVVLQQLPSNATAKPSLAFTGNIQNMLVQASIPKSSMLLAVVGCIIMVLGGVTISLFGKRGGRALHQHSTAVTTAEAIANQDKFPPFILQMQLRDTNTGKVVDVSLDSLRVVNVVLVNEANEAQQFIVGGECVEAVPHTTATRISDDVV